MPYPLPSWIKAPDDPAQAYISAFHAGSAVVGQQAQLQQQANQHATQFAVQQQQLQAQNLRAQQELEMQKAFHEATIGVRQAQLGEAQQKLNIVAQNAAQKLVAQKNFSDMVQGGAEPLDAFIKSGLGASGSGAGLATAAKALYEQKHPFEPYDVTTQSGIPMVMESRGRAAFRPSQTAQGGNVQTGLVLGPDGKPIPGMVAVGGRARNEPGYKDPNANEIKEIWKQWGPYLAGLQEPDEKTAKGLEKAKARLTELQTPPQAVTNAPAAAASGPVVMKNSAGQLVKVPAEKIDWAKQNGYTPQ